MERSTLRTSTPAGTVSTVGAKFRMLVIPQPTIRSATSWAASVAIGVIATPAAAAQQVCDRLVAAGVTSILNFAPTVLSVPDGVDVRKVDLSIELQILAYHEQRKANGQANGQATGQTNGQPDSQSTGQPNGQSRAVVGA